MNEFKEPFPKLFSTNISLISKFSQSIKENKAKQKINK